MAKRFQFRLDTVERLRKQDVDRRRRVVAEAVRSVTTAEAQLADITRQLRETVEISRGERQASRPDVAALRSHESYGGWLQGKALEAQARLATQRGVLRAERDKLAETSKRLKVIEKLREREWSRFKRDEARREQREADEIGLQQYVRDGINVQCAVEAGHER